MSSTQSVSNNCNRPLTAADTFTGAWESSAGALVLGVFIASPTLGLLTIQQSNNRGTTIQLTDTFNINAAELDNMNVFRVPSGFPFFRVLFQNAEGAQTYLSLNTYLEDFYNQTAITGVVDVTGSVAVSNLITETLATRRVDFLVVGDYYRVATVGITSGAQWNAIGAIVDGESVPVIGRLFKCLQVGPAVAGGGTCYDVEYTDAVSATITNFPSFPAVQAVSGTVSLTNPTTVRVSDYYGDPILTTSGNLMVGINNIYTANPLHTILDSGSVTATPPSASAISFLSVGTTGQTIKASAGVLKGLHINSNGVVDTAYAKLYNVAVPTSGDTPVMVFAVPFGSFQNIDAFSTGFATAIGVRVSAGAGDSNNSAPTNNVNITAFYV